MQEEHSVIIKAIVSGLNSHGKPGCLTSYSDRSNSKGGQGPSIRMYRRGRGRKSPPSPVEGKRYWVTGIVADPSVRLEKCETDTSKGVVITLRIVEANGTMIRVEAFDSEQLIDRGYDGLRLADIEINDPDSLIQLAGVLDKCGIPFAA